VVAVRRDQRQRFGCPILLDASTSHESLRLSGEGRTGRRHFEMYGRGCTFGKSSGRSILKTHTLAAILLLPLLAARENTPLRLHTIRLSGEASDDRYWFTPARLTVSPGDTLEFSVASGGPHALGVDPTGMTDRAKESWNQALPRRTGALRSPLLRTGQPYRVVVPRGMEPGKYTFFCLAHRAYDMRLEVEVK
jgi:plastocyanin